MNNHENVYRNYVLHAVKSLKYLVVFFLFFKNVVLFFCGTYVPLGGGQLICFCVVFQIFQRKGKINIYKCHLEA